MKGNVVEALRHHSGERPAHRAVALPYDQAGPVRVTFSELDHQARRVASLLQGEVARGARAVLVHEPGLDFLHAFLGCLYARVIAAAVFPPADAPPHGGRRSDALERVVEDSGADVVLCAGATRALATHPEVRARPALARARWLATDDLAAGAADDYDPPVIRAHHAAFLQYTSGSTKAPKGVMVTHGNVLQNDEDLRQIMQHGPDSVSVSWLPHFHDMGLVWGVLQPLYSGFPGYLMPPACVHPAAAALAAGDLDVQGHAQRRAQLRLRAVREPRHARAARPSRPRLLAGRVQRGGARPAGHAGALRRGVRSLRLPAAGARALLRAWPRRR